MDEISPEDPWSEFHGKTVKEIIVYLSGGFDIRFTDGTIIQLDSRTPIHYHVANLA